MSDLLFEPAVYQKQDEPKLISFLEKCLPESHRYLDINGRHSYYKETDKHFKDFWCIFNSGEIIGTVAVSELDSESCELKSLYLLKEYHGKGLGKALLDYAIKNAKAFGYKKMYLDSLSTSDRAIALYRKAGFTDTEKYNNSEYADVFMVLEL